MLDLDAIHHVKYSSPAAIVFQSSTSDVLIDEAEAQLYYDTADQPKAIRGYEADHWHVKEDGQADRLQWLSKQLGFEYP